MNKKRWFYIFFIAMMFGVFPSGVKAAEYEVGGMDVQFHGYLESNLILRDTSIKPGERVEPGHGGFQNGFFNDLDAIQQRNTLKFDVDVYPKLDWGPFALKKIHLTYRGSYDSIFDLRKGAYGDIDEDGGPSRFDFGKRDIKWENDLREAFVDFTYDGPLGTAFLRPGRQLVSWGEAAGLTLMDVINPPDNSFQMFFLNPDDLKIPLWMGRLNYSLPPLPIPLKINFDLLFVPDIRPTQFAPRDRSMAAPYAFLFRGLAPFNVREVVPTDKREYGIKMTMDIGEPLSVSLAYFRDVVSDPAIVLTDFRFIPGVGPIPTSALFTHSMRHVVGGYFSYYFGMIDAVIRGEFAYQTDTPVSLPSPDVVRGPGGLAGLELRTFRLKPVVQWMLALDKNVRIRFIQPRERVSLSFQWLHKKINSWEDIFDRSLTVPRNQDFFTFQTNWFWRSGTISPVLFVIFSPESGGKGGGTWMTQPSVTWFITPTVYAKVSMQAFWGNREAKSSFAGLIDTSEATVKIGYQW